MFSNRKSAIDRGLAHSPIVRGHLCRAEPMRPIAKGSER